METAPLKSFATSARRELIREVGARITAVLAQGSPERVEQPKAVAALELAIAGAGGGDTGKAHVADKVAYTWFNRIIALRFMDANGYTGIGVVSPAADQVGQPEVLAAAKRGQLDTDVVKGTNAATVSGLLNGTRQPRPGVDAQAEAYALLLADYCRFWNKAMPFMFEREGDYTELLIPANLLAEDSVLSRSVTVLTEDVCQDVEVIGWLYQFYISERKDEVFAGFKKNKKAGADEIPAATQLFTPHWIVRYLVENSVGRLWMLNRPSSGLANQMDYYIAPVDEDADFLKISKPEELKVIDPACGSGHMLTYAFDLLYAIYEEEGYVPSEIPGLILANNLYGTEIDPRAGALAAFALSMKARAKQRTFFNKKIEPSICVLDPISFSPDELSYLVTKDGDRYAEEAFWYQFSEADTLGSLIQPDPDLGARLARHLETLADDGDMYKADAVEWAWRAIRQAEYLTPRYSVSIANPPYMGNASMGPLLSDFVKNQYPESKTDLYSAFIDRSVSLVGSAGYVAMVTMQAWMFLSSFEKFRRRLLSKHALATMAHLGTGAFDSIGGAVVSTTAFVLKRTRVPASSVLFIRAVGGDNEAAKRAILLAAAEGDVGHVHVISASDLLRMPSATLSYWLSDEAREIVFGAKTVGDAFDVKAGISTGDNATSFKQWFEVSLDRTTLHGGSGDWHPHNKGGGYRRWYGNLEYVLRYSPSVVKLMEARPGFRHDGKDYYFKAHVGWSQITSGDSSFRLYDAGLTFGSGGLGIFASNEESLLRVAAYLNSPVAREIIGALNPTLNVSPGSLAAVPLPDLSGVRLELVHELVRLQRDDWNSREVAWGFECLPLVAAAEPSVRRAVDAVHRDEVAAAGRVVTLERELFGSAGFGVDPELAEPPSVSAGGLVAELVSYAVGCMFGRYSLNKPGLILADQGATLQDYLARVPTPSFTPDADNVIPIVDGDWFEDDVVGLFRRFLRTTFGAQHFEENLKFVTESLGVKNLRDYFITRSGRSKFYDDHVQRYKKRPIYWLFSSPKGSFNGLIYMHRYTPSTVSTVLTYLREYVTKLESVLQQAERAGNAKEADRLRKILVELNEYEHDTLYPKASENVVIDLDDGVKANYPKLGAALKKVAGLEVNR